MSLDGGTLLNDKVDGDPQYLLPGDSTITWTGTVTKLVVTPNWRFYNIHYLEKLPETRYIIFGERADILGTRKRLMVSQIRA